MDIFAQKKLLTRLVLILAILNISIIGIMVWKDLMHRPPHPHHGREDFRDVSALLEKELQLTSTQAIQFNELRNTYSKREHNLHELIRNQRDSMNEQMFNETTDESLLKSIAMRVSQNEYQMELLRIEQAAAVKKICNPEQLQKFESLMFEIRDYFRPDNQPHGPR